MARKNESDFLRSLLVLLTEALVFNDQAISRVRNGEPYQKMISDLNGNKLYLTQTMEWINTRIRKKAQGL